MGPTGYLIIVGPRRREVLVPVDPKVSGEAGAVLDVPSGPRISRDQEGFWVDGIPTLGVGLDYMFALNGYYNISPVVFAMIFSVFV